MIRHLILSGYLLLATLPAMKAASIDGIRIESPHRKIVVLVDGQQVCLPTFSCFVANLHGSYQVEVYEAPSHGENPRRGKLLYDERVHCSINEVKDILIPKDKRVSGNRGTSNHHKPGRPGDRPIEGQYERVMSPSAFEQFMGLMEKQNFDSDRKEVLDHALLTSWFTAVQCTRLIDFYRFDSEKKQLMKKIYPKIADKPNFYYAIDKLTFSSDKNEINAFIKQYHEKNN